MNRREAREILLQTIFQIDIQKDYTEDFLEHIINEQGDIPQKQADYMKRTYHNYLENRGQIDEIINNYSLKWSVNHLPKSELAILRLGVAEVKYCDEIPVAVAINEAVELAKKYGENNASIYINGVLGKVASEK